MTATLDPRLPVSSVLPPPPARRWTEAGLLVFAALLATGAVAAVVYARTGSVSSSVLWYGAGFAALYAVAHLGIRRFAPYADPLLLPLMAVLNGVGLAMIYRIDEAFVDRAHRLGKAAPSGNAPLQMVWTAVALAVFLAVLVIVRDHRTLSRYSYTAGLVGLGLLLLPAVPGVGTTINGARLWLRLGPITIQPSEFAKILLLIFLAGYLVSKRDVLSLVTHSFLGLPLPRARDLGPVLVAWAASLAVLIVEKDLGSSLLFFGMFLVVLYVATERVSWLLIGLVMFAAGAYGSYLLFAHVQERVDIWLHPFQGSNPTGKSYQLVQGLFGFATGGIFGTGWGQGRPDIVPFARTDFILASLGEELGLIGVMAILMIYTLIVMRGLRAALRVRDSFGKLLAVGLAFSFALQVFVTVGGVTRLIPLTGLTLPFISYGGSSMVANAALIALLLRVSDAGRRPPAQPGAAPLVDPAAARQLLDAPTQVVRR
jgi:cell division protein FtsW (lipid II flippase)